MLERSVKIHDKYQLEIKYGYKISDKRKKTLYNIDSYFFFPESLGINSQTYTKKIFYKDIQSYLRFKTPTYLLNQIFEGKNSPIFSLKKSMELLLQKNDREHRENFDYNIKMVCSIFKSSLRDYLIFLKRDKNIQNPILVERYMNYSKSILKEYRSLIDMINVPIIEKKLMIIFKLGDEFMSHNLEYYSYKLLKLLNKSDTIENGINKKILKGMITDEFDYRIKENFHPAPGNERDNEVLVFRRGILKKYISSALFLDTNWKPEGKLIEQILIGIAAGLAMAFATLVAFYAQKKYGNLTFPFFSFLVVGYIFKDRIKELTRSYLVGKIRSFNFDNNVDIFSDKKKVIGKYHEGVNFIKESGLPDDIKAIRKKEFITDIENLWLGEKVMLHRKKVILFSDKLKKVYKGYKINGVNDIVRFNISRFLNKMDNPFKKIFLIEDDKEKELIADRVYHINMITKITKNKKVFYNRYRIILTSNGIKRVENIEPGI